MCDKDGKRPEGVLSTWQFNFSFDLDNEMYNKESIELLTNTGIDFNRLKENGIDRFEFAQSLIDSGLCLLENTNWISFHAGYDFGFLISLMINKEMSSKESEFDETLSKYFINFYDVKLLSTLHPIINSKQGVTLESLSEDLGFSRLLNLGNLMQVGGQSLLTYLNFWELKRSIDRNEFESLKNQIFGLSDERKLENPNTSNNQANISVEYSSFSPDGKPVLTDKQKQLPSSLQQKRQPIHHGQQQFFSNNNMNMNNPVSNGMNINAVSQLNNMAGMNGVIPNLNSLNEMNTNMPQGMGVGIPNNINSINGMPNIMGGMNSMNGVPQGMNNIPQGIPQGMNALGGLPNTMMGGMNNMPGIPQGMGNVPQGLPQGMNNMNPMLMNGMNNMPQGMNGMNAMNGMSGMNGMNNMPQGLNGMSGMNGMVNMNQVNPPPGLINH
ncbi:Poly(A) ribonuclease pop2 [Pichia kudriavzevii]|uniref:Poly(A) ribonuclease pop2 n=1 Tax=Pichia kudriavzevii TaxID=4909 RepID=A0A1V2LK77_PICKU|nr:Poly(A) ribonuclease pop2 [Pichia kudriavzevii]